MKCPSPFLYRVKWSTVDTGPLLSSFLYAEVTEVQDGQLTSALLRWKQTSAKSKCSHQCRKFQFLRVKREVIWSLLYEVYKPVNVLLNNIAGIAKILLLRAGIESNPGPPLDCPGFRLLSQNCRGLSDCKKLVNCYVPCTRRSLNQTVL